MPEPDTTPATCGCARERAEAIADAACPEEEIQARLDDYAVEVAQAERIAAYRAAADWLTAEYPGPGADRSIRLAADRLRVRADQMEQP